MYLHSIQAYADKIVDEIDESSQHALRNMAITELSGLHHTWGRAIRNEFKLWAPDHPLTREWHDGSSRVIIDDCDYSKYHPDHVSMLIMEAVWKKVNA